MNDSNLLEIFDKAIESDDLGVIRECLSKGVIITSKSLSKCRFICMNAFYYGNMETIFELRLYK